MKNFLTVISLISILFIGAASVSAQSGAIDTTGGSSGAIDSTLTLTNPLSVDSPQALIGRIINTALGVVGSLALLMFVFGGLTWMTSSGNQEKVKKGRDIIVWSAIGLAVIFTSYALTRFVLSTVSQ
ncbi:MAG: pilin [Patescibacteria group bacterium]